MDKMKELVNPKTGSRFPIGGCKPSKPSSTLPKFGVSRMISDHELPASVDLRPNMTPVETKTKKEIDVSRLFIYYNARLKDGISETDMSDEGCSITAAIEALKEYGCCKEEIFPYEVKNVNRKPPEYCYKVAKAYHIECGLRVAPNLTEMKACLAQGYPFAFGLTIYTSFSEAETNGRHVPTPNADEPIVSSYGLHAMLAAGYHDEGQYFIVKNSWGALWGDKGYCYIPYDYMSNPKHCFDMYTIKTISGNSPRSDKATRYVSHGTDVSNTNILVNDFPDATDMKLFWNTKNTTTWTSESYHKVAHSSIKQSSEAIITGNSRVLWIDRESEENNRLMKKISIEACTAVEFCERFSSLEQYLQQHSQEASSSSSAFQIICRGYYKNEDKNPLDVLLLLDRYELGHVPVTVFTQDKEGLMNHLRNEAFSKGISAWKDRLHVARYGTDLINRIVSNNKKTSSNHNRN
ncbi:unnamed protein product [Rotaria socialis]|uniref:Peptidase C1A papain C-terminal domain-containing protein n=1 Tax=Rotaria socialis TaxID=392032 RepID=A0A818ASL0_9BILA|nr:unnamed protein product [Rotaria socialis]